MQVISTGALVDDNRRTRWNSFLAGLTINAAGILLLIVVEPRLGSNISVEPLARLDSNIPLIYEPPPSSPAVVAKLEAPKMSPVVKSVAKPEPRIATPQIEAPKPESPRMVAAETMPVAPPTPTPQVDRNQVDRRPSGFEAAKAEPATVHLAPRKVQTGGFGDPNGVTGQSDAKRNTVRVASVGSFELPSGPGKGNGTGGTRGVSGTVAASGFGNGVATDSLHVNGGSVMAGGFGERVAQGGSNARPREKAPELRPVEIVFKPRPAYTQEALKQKVEGEVLLDVVFSASGALHVNRVVKGLGYGLDDQALAVARQIQFRPARRDGQPYDCAALVHIVFELSK